ncbi:MAG: VanZ family protein [Eubacteriaceae bacterium]|nr:VanZ family protein [Eubacteriaceae bacterium]
MLFDTASGSSSLFVTALVMMLVVIMPAADIFICRKLKLDPIDGVSDNPRGDIMLSLRSAVIAGVFLLYLAGFSYITFFSRAASDEYLIHTQLFDNLIGSVRIDFGFLGVLYRILTGEFSGLAEHFSMPDMDDILQVYLNVVLFIPMGYLLPYMSEWFRKRLPLAPVTASFLISLAVENIQLITRRGFYDVDDIVTNTLGGFLGALLFTAFAFRVTHPDWKRDLGRYRRWRKNARKRTLYPFARKVNLSRTVLYATDETSIWDFYVVNYSLLRLKP